MSPNRQRLWATDAGWLRSNRLSTTNTIALLVDIYRPDKG